MGTVGGCLHSTTPKHPSFSLPFHHAILIIPFSFSPRHSFLSQVTKGAELKGQPLLIQFIDTVIGTNALVRTAASAWKLHRHAGEEPRARHLQPINKPFSHLPPSLHPRGTSYIAICGAHFGYNRVRPHYAFCCLRFSHAPCDGPWKSNVQIRPNPSAIL